VDTERLGMADLQVFPIAFGTWQLGGDWGAFDEREAIAAIRHARELGITLFDIAQADGFGASERLLGRALRDKLVDEGKIRHVGVSNSSPAQIAEFARARPVETLQPPSHLFRRTVSQLAIAWTLAHPAVDVAIVGARGPAPR
jgi:aryl-alcohol dehydrogenase-like predicted oxidoreductase